jgi:hypothetical protein
MNCSRVAEQVGQEVRFNPVAHELVAGSQGEHAGLEAVILDARKPLLEGRG